MSPVPAVRPTRPLAVVVLAAGEGKRMHSALPKVLHSVGGVSLLGHAVQAARALDPEHLVVVVGHGRDQVCELLAQVDSDATAVVQHEQRGTGHAVRIALEDLDAVDGTVVVTCADTPLLTARTLSGLLAGHVESQASATLLTVEVDDPAGYGRVLRAEDGSVRAIVEDRDASDEQRAVREINSGVYAFDGTALLQALRELSSDNSQGEEYLTDVVAAFGRADRPVAARVLADPSEVRGVNDRIQLAEVGALLRDRVLSGWMRAGVTVIDPATTWVDATVRLAADVELRPGTQLLGATSVGAGATIGPDTTLTDSEVGAGAQVLRSHVTSARIGPKATVGPFAHLRPGTVLAEGAKIGEFVGTKNARIGVGAKVPHLSYVGDAEVGAGSNIGAGSVFVNYDGVEKHRTVVGEHVRIGSDTMLIAPLTVGDGAYTAAGSVVTEDVPPGAMAVGRAKQRTIREWVARRRAGSESAQAAARATSATAEWGNAGESGSDRHPNEGRDA